MKNTAMLMAGNTLDVLPGKGSGVRPPGRLVLWASLGSLGRLARKVCDNSNQDDGSPSATRTMRRPRGWTTKSVWCWGSSSASPSRRPPSWCCTASECSIGFVSRSLTPLRFLDPLIRDEMTAKTDRQTGRQTDRQTDRQADRQTDKQLCVCAYGVRAVCVWL